MLICHLLSSASQPKALNRQNCASSPEQDHLSNWRRCQWHCHDQVSSHWHRIVRVGRDGGSAGFRLRAARVQNAMETASGPWQVELYQDLWDDSLLLLQKHAFHDTSVDYCLLCRVLRSDIVRWRLCNILQPNFHCFAFDIQSCSWTGCQLHV